MNAAKQWRRRQIAREVGFGFLITAIFLLVGYALGGSSWGF